MESEILWLEGEIPPHTHNWMVDCGENGDITIFICKFVWRSSKLRICTCPTYLDLEQVKDRLNILERR